MPAAWLRRSSFRSLSFALVSFVLCSVSSGGCVATGWQQLKTKRVTGYAQGARHYRDSMARLEYAYGALSAFFPRADVGSVEVLFLPSPTMVELFGVHRGGLVFAEVPGAGRLGRKNLVVMFADADGSQSPSLLSHLFLHKAIPNAPLWLHQAVRMYFSRTIVQGAGGRWQACFGKERGSLASRNTPFMPLERFFQVGWKDYPFAGTLQYQSTATLLMNYVLHGEGGANLAKLPAIFSAAGQGVPGPEIMAATFPGQTLAQLGQRLYDFGTSESAQRSRVGPCPLPVEIPGAKAPDESEPRESPMQTADVDELVAALARLPHGDRFPGWYPPELFARPVARATRTIGLSQTAP